MSSFLELFDFSQFMPHGMCFLWRWDLLILHVGSDLMIAAAYFSIPAAIFTFIRKRTDIRDNNIAYLFAAFILLCGITHVSSIVTIWYPAYIIEGMFKLATGLVSVATAITLWRLIPRALAVPSAQQMAARNREIGELNRRLQQRIDSLTTLAGGVSHDFNNILTVIHGHAQLLERPDMSEEDRSSIEAILESSRRAAELCRQMLAYSGRGHFVLAKTDLNDVISHSELPTRLNCDITYSLASKPAQIQGSPDQLAHLLTSLVTNAIEAIDAISGKGRIVISTSVASLTADELEAAAFETDMGPGDAVVLEVRDNGPGMDRQVVERVFEPYFSTKFTGRGLGMAAVQGIVRGHGGALFVTSTPGAGTSIRVAFPQRSTSSLQYREPMSPVPKRVLVVDDEPEVAALAAQYLESMGIEVLVTTDPIEAMTLVRKHRNELDALIVDYLMPQVTGTELLEEVAGIIEVDAYLTSGYSRGELDEPQLRKLLTGFIAKPFTRRDFQLLFGQTSQPPSSTEPGDTP